MGDGRGDGGDDGKEGGERDGEQKARRVNSRPSAISRVEGAKPQHSWCLPAATTCRYLSTRVVQND